MAVWTFAYGKNELMDLNLQQEDYLSLIKNVKVDAVKILDSLDTRPRLSSFTDVYKNVLDGKLIISWKSKSEQSYSFLVQYPPDYPDGIKIHLQNDLVWITGPFNVFSNYSQVEYIAQGGLSYYHQIFKEIMKVFKSDFILYAHEWSGIDYEDIDYTFKQLIEESGIDLKNDVIPTNIDIKRFYYEKL